MNFDGRHIFWEASGHGFPLVLHHGFSQWGRDWLNAGWTKGLESRRRVISFDMLGHGRSDRPHQIDPYRIERRAETLVAVMDAAGAERFDVFGFSLGGRVAYATAEIYPDRVRGLIVGGMHAMDPKIDRLNLEKRVQAMRTGRLAAVERAVGIRAVNAKHDVRPPNDPEALALTTEALFDWDGSVEALRQSDSPALLFCGQLDPLYYWTHETSNALHNARFLSLPHVGHAKTFYRPELSLDAIQNFLDGLRS